MRSDDLADARREVTDLRTQVDILSSLIKFKIINSLVMKRFVSIQFAVVSLLFAVENPKNELIYTLSLGVSSNRYGKKELCELETIIKSFKLN